MWDGKLVVDGVAHAYAFQASNRVESCPREAYDGLISFLWSLAHVPLESLAPGYQMTLEEFSAGWTAEELASMFFEESDVDVISYHGVEISAFFKGGATPWPIGVELKKAYPDRVILYAPVDPFRGPGELEAMEAKVAECQVDGFKFYPSNGLVDPERNETVALLYDDREVAFPYFEKARELGVNQIAIHKALPVGPGRLNKDQVEDMSTAALAFPDLSFEVVHSGWAFLEDCALQLMLHPNIWANLECVANFVVRQPLKFAHIVGTLLQYGGPDRVIFGTGAALAHPQPILEAFANFQMPQELQDGFGYPELTDEIKAKILGGNIARLHGLDVEATKRAIADDEWAQRRAATRANGVTPYRLHRERLAGRERQLA